MNNKKKTVYIVTGLNLGWDCVVGVWDADSVSLEELCKEYDFDPDTGASDEYIIHEQTLATSL